ncbi:MAG: bifunctional UDP-4-keto-pentose/UDP-xylose synthase [Verrucomicrobiota bacterium]
MRILILGANGFIGNSLVSRILKTTDWEVVGMDLEQDRFSREVFEHPRFLFQLGDLAVNHEWIEMQIKRSDAVLPLAAKAIPTDYLENPMGVFELNFEENLKVIRSCVKHGKRLIFPSTSEVYGMCKDDVFDEESSHFTLGPINKHRWIYSCAKQMLDRVIHAYGLQQNFDYTIIRPFNWIGPKLDRIHPEKMIKSRVVTQFMDAVLFNRPISLVDGGKQKRCFIYIDDGIDALMKIIANKNGKASRQIFNIGNPYNELSIAKLVQVIVDLYQKHPRSKQHPFTAGVRKIASAKYYGKGYQDVSYRKPAIAKSKKLLGWQPQIDITTALSHTLNSFVGMIETTK